MHPNPLHPITSSRQPATYLRARVHGLEVAAQRRVPHAQGAVSCAAASGQGVALGGDKVWKGAMGVTRCGRYTG